MERVVIVKHQGIMEITASTLNVDAVIYDYDVEGVEEESLSEDECGNKCIIIRTITDDTGVSKDPRQEELF